MARQFTYDTVPAVLVTGGKIHGYQLDGTFIFKGVPYAQAKRFHLPQPPEPWEGIRETASYGYVCPMLQQDTPVNELLAPHRYWPQDENCLNLNIWTQSLDGKKPVVVWIHGGAFSTGSSIEQKVYNGENMSRLGDCVVVSVNHRLNILGYFDLSEYGEEYADSANLGQEDLIAALRWIQENIRAFGGDPNNVTLVGQSGGGMKISCLMQMPAADGLFHKAVIMSGEAGDYMPYPTGSAKPIVQALLQKLNLPESRIQELETIPYHDLAQAYNQVSMPLAIEGKYIGSMPKPNDFFLGVGPKVGFRKETAGIPVIVGTTFSEFTPNPLPISKSQVSIDMLETVLNQRFGIHKEEICRAYREAYPDKHLADLLTLDIVFRGPSQDLIRAFAQAGNPVYSYVFALEFPFHDHQIAWHCADIPFVFHNTELSPVANLGEESDRLEAQIFDSFMTFVRTGEPDCDNLPHWPASTAEDEATMIFDRQCRLQHNFDHEVLHLIEKATPKFDLIQALTEMAKNAVH